MNWFIFQAVPGVQSSLAALQGKQGTTSKQYLYYEQLYGLDKPPLERFTTYFFHSSSRDRRHNRFGEALQHSTPNRILHGSRHSVRGPLGRHRFIPSGHWYRYWLCDGLPDHFLSASILDGLDLHHRLLFYSPLVSLGRRLSPHLANYRNSTLPPIRSREAPISLPANAGADSFPVRRFPALD